MIQFLYQLIAPRPTFVADMTEAERATMDAHAGYWRDLTERGACLIFGPVLDPAGPWGLAIVETSTEDEASTIFQADPAITSGMCTYQMAPMMVAQMRRQERGRSR